MDAYSLIKTVHILGAAVLFGTGAGIAFFMLRGWLSKDTRVHAEVASGVVLADFAFTLPAVILQPLTGYLLIAGAGFDPLELWLVVSYGLYVLTGVCWLPVVWIQMRMKQMAVDAVLSGEALPGRYNRLFAVWCALGVPAFASVVAIFWLMVAKPQW